MAHVDAEVSGPADADQGVHVGPVHVNLSSGAVDDLANVSDAFLEDAVCRRVSDHQCSQLITMAFSEFTQVVQVDIAVLSAANRDDLETCHDGACGIGSMGRLGNQTYPAVFFTAGPMVAADGQQTGVFALSSGIGLNRYGLHTGDLCQHALQARDELEVAGGLLDRSERMDAAPLRPGDGKHLDGSVQLHGA